MRRSLLLGAVLASAITLAQEPVNPSLAAFRLATGWTEANRPSDIVVKGRVTTRSPEGETRSTDLVIKAKVDSDGTVLYRYESDSGKNITIISGDSGQIKSGDKTRNLTSREVLNGQPWLLGVITRLAGTPHRAVVSTGGPTEELLKLVASEDNEDLDLTLQLDSLTKIPKELRFRRFGSENATAFVPVVWKLKNLKHNGRFALAYSIEEFIHGQLVMSIEIDEVLIDSDVSRDQFMFVQERGR